ncbi:MAG: SRPBCC domain-containing protein [Thermoplasmata archaeon]
MKVIEVEVSISARRDMVWSAWTRSDIVASWFAPEANVEARVGGAFELFFDPSDHEHQCTKGCIFTLIEPEKRLGFTWRGPDQFERLMNTPTSATSVLVTLHAEDGTTRVVVEHRGWGESEEWERARTWHERAWEEVLRSLKAHLEAKEGS